MNNNLSIKGPGRLWPVAMCFAAALSVSYFADPAGAVERQFVGGHVPRAVIALQSTDRLPGQQQLHLAFGLPLRNREALTNLIEQLYDPASTNFHRYLTPQQFAASFGPDEQDYQRVIDFAKSNGLDVTGTHPNRTLLDVTGSVTDIEKALHVTIQVYQHPAEARTFYAPNVEPSLDLNVPVLHISGLDNFVLLRPNITGYPLTNQKSGGPKVGSGPGGQYWGYDFRTAYAPGVIATGSGQTVALFELEGFLGSDVTTYESQAGLPNVPLEDVAIDGFSFVPNNNDTNGVLEVCMDIEVAIAMAPGLSKVLIYGATNGFGFENDILNRMATDNRAEQISSSWGINVNASTEQIFQQFAVQGQSFFMAVGDVDAYSGPISFGYDDPYITVVGGTELTTDANTKWVSERVWNNNYSSPGGTNGGGSGGFSASYPIPLWQSGIDMSTNQGSATKRNIPDVAMVSFNVYAVARGNLAYNTSGTSIAAPLWAAFTALINQQAAASARPPIGFLNPALYAIGRGPGYTTNFHDITVGNNTNNVSPTRFFAVPGYDLCTGWGTPTGTNLINSLTGFAGAVWVDFSNPNPGDGSYTNSFNTLARGTNGVPFGGTIAIKGPSSTLETMSIAKPMTLRPAGGIVSIGR